MMDVASLVRIFEPSPTDDFVTKRIAAIGEIATKIRAQRTVNTILSFADSIASGISTGQVGGSLSAEVVTILQKESPSFVQEGQEVQILVCAIAAAQSVLTDVKPSGHGRTTPEIFSAALLSCLSYLKPHQQPQIEKLKGELLKLASENLEQTADASRKRQQVPETPFVVDPNDDASTVANKAKAAIEKVTAPLISNARLDREELDLLWWCVSDWSNALKAKVTSFPPNLGMVAAALEVGLCIRKFPCTAHAHIAMRNVTPSEPQTLAEINLDFAGKRFDLFGFLQEMEGVFTYKFVFPALSFLFRAPEEESQIDTSAKLSQIDWVKRLLLEIRLSKVRLQDTVSL